MSRFDPLEPFRAIEKSLAPLRAIEKSLGPVLAAQEALAPFRAAQKAIGPRLPFDSLSTLSAVEKAGASAALPKLAMPIGKFPELYGPVRLGSTESKLFRTVAGKWSAMGGLSENFGLPKMGHVGAAFEAANSFARLREKMGIKSFGWVSDLSNLMAEAQSVSEGIVPTAVIPPVILVPKRSRLKQIQVTCAFCGDELSRRTHQTEEEVKVEVVPLCATCQRKWHDDPAYMSRELRRFMSPKLRLIEGGAKSESSKPTGHLRLLPPPDEHGEDVD